MIRIKNHRETDFNPYEMIIDPKAIKGIMVSGCERVSRNCKEREALFLITGEGFGSVYVNEADKDKIVKVLQDIHEGKEYQFEKL
jgi:hypothetical protein